MSNVLLCRFSIFFNNRALKKLYTREQGLKFGNTKVLTSTFVSSNLKRRFSLIKTLSWLEADLQMLLYGD